MRVIVQQAIQVDVLSLFGLMLEELWGRSARKPRQSRTDVYSGQFVLDQIAAMDEPQGRYGHAEGMVFRSRQRRFSLSPISTR